MGGDTKRYRLDGLMWAAGGAWTGMLPQPRGKGSARGRQDASHWFVTSRDPACPWPRLTHGWRISVLRRWLLDNNAVPASKFRPSWHVCPCWGHTWGGEGCDTLVSRGVEPSSFPPLTSSTLPPPPQSLLTARVHGWPLAQAWHYSGPPSMTIDTYRGERMSRSLVIARAKFTATSNTMEDFSDGQSGLRYGTLNIDLKEMPSWF